MRRQIKRRFTLRGIGFLLLPGILSLGATLAQAATRTWTGAGADANASTPENWSDDTAPVAGDHVVFDDSHAGNAQTNIVWDVDPGVTGFASWTQTADYDGMITIMTRYHDAGGFTNLHISGNVLLEGGVWTHEGPQSAQIHNLGVSVGGDFTLGDSAAINLNGKGWDVRVTAAPGGASTGQHSAFTVGASHGGMGGCATGKATIPMARYSNPSTWEPAARVPKAGARFACTVTAR